MKKIILYLFGLIIGFAAVPGWAQLYSDNFDSYAAGSVPTGWTSYTTQTDDPGFQVVADSGIARSPYQILAHLGVNINRESTSWIVSPAFNLGDNQELIFYWREKWAYAYNYSGVYISTGSSDPISNPNDFQELAEFDPDDYDTWNEWNKAMFDLRDYANQTVYIAFKYTGDFAHDFYVDDFQISDIPYCNPTPNIEVTNYTDTTLDVQWDAVTGVDQYEIVWGPTGFDPNTGTPELVTGTTYTITGLQPATWYDIYVRAACSPYNYSSWAGPEAGRTSGPPPVNDTCGGAIEIPVGTTCTNTVISNFDATDSGVPDPNCGNYNGGDVWFKFTAPSNDDIVVKLSGIAGSDVHDTGMALYDGDCSNLNLIECDDDGGPGLFSSITISATAGTTYYVRVWEYGNNAFGEFNICAFIPSPPNNDNCMNGLVVHIQDSTCSNIITVDNSLATDSGVSAPNCANYQGNDIWFKVVVPASGHVEMETVNVGGVNDTGMAFYTGSCSNLTEVDCNDDGGSNLMSRLVADGYTPGDTLYVRVWAYGNGSQGDIGFCAYDPNYTSVQDLTAKGFSFYPNPTEGRITLSANEAIDRVEITSITGQVLYREELHTDNHSLDITRLPSGIYLMNVYIGNDKGTYRIVKE